MIDLVIIGAGGFAREVAWLVESINQMKASYRLMGHISSSSTGDAKLLGDDDWALQNLPSTTQFVVAIGNASLRKKITQTYEQKGFTAATLIHPDVRFAKGCEIGVGSMICAGAIFTVNIHIGRHCIVNLNSTIGHDSRIGDYVTISPGTQISGGVIIEDEVEIGTGASILQNIKLGKGLKLGAGAVATKDLEGGNTYVGVPARLIKGSS